MSSQQNLQNQQVINVTETEQVVDVSERRVQHNTNIIGAQSRSIIDTQKHLATEIPITTEKYTTTEYVPVTMEKIIQRIPVVVGQRLETGIPLQGQTDIQAMGVQYVQQEIQTEVDLIPEMHTRVGQMEAVQQQVIGGKQIISQSQPIQQQQLTQAQLLQNQQFGQQQMFGQQLGSQQMRSQQFGQPIMGQQLGQPMMGQQLNQPLMGQQLGQPMMGQQLGQQGLYNQQPLLNQAQQPTQLSQRLEAEIKEHMPKKL